MSLPRRCVGADLLASPVRRAVGRAVARVRAWLRRRPARLDEEGMPDWQLRDLGLRDGRTTSAREAVGWGKADPRLFRDGR